MGFQNQSGRGKASHPWRRLDELHLGRIARKRGPKVLKAGGSIRPKSGG